MSGLITAVLLVAFSVAFLMQGTAYEHLTPYVDPAVLAALTLCLIPVPLRTIVQALSEIFLVAPRDLDRQARAAAEAAVEKHGLAGYRTYVAKVGRSRLVEIHLILPPRFAIGTVETLDVIREEISEGIGGAGPDRWLTVVFTGNERWAI